MSGKGAIGCALAAVLGIVAAILILFGVLMMIGSTDPVQGNPGWFGTGVFLVIVGLALAGGSVGLIVWSRRREAQAAQGGPTIVQKIELPGQVALEGLKCRNCGAPLTAEDIKVIEGAPVVTCPYCKATYQLTESPKW